MVDVNKFLYSPLFELTRKGKPVNILIAILFPPFLFIAMQLIGGLINKILTRGLDTSSSPFTAGIVQTLHYTTGFALIILAICAFVIFVEKRGVATIGLRPRGALIKYAVGAVMAFALYGLAIGLQVATGNAAVSLNAESIGTLVLAGIGITLIGFVVQGGAEEVVFRGWMTPVIGVRYGPLAGILTSSILFGLLHVIAGATPSEVFYTILAGIFMALYAVREGGIWGVCGFHAFWNWLSTNVLVQNGEAETSSLVLVSLQPTGQYIDAIYAVVFIVAIAAALAITIKYNKKESATPVKG